VASFGGNCTKKTVIKIKQYKLLGYDGGENIDF
jgi:hypothetical protein